MALIIRFLESGRKLIVMRVKVKVGDELYLKFSLYQETKPNLKVLSCLFSQEIEQERAAMAEYEKRIRAEGRAAAEKAVAAAQPNEPCTFSSLGI